MPGWHQKTHPREQMAYKCGPGAGRRDGLVGERGKRKAQILEGLQALTGHHKLPHFCPKH